MFYVDTTNHIEIGSDFIRFFVAIILVVTCYFFSFHILRFLAKSKKLFAEKIGVYANDKEYQLQRYVYQHSRSPISRLYRFVNEQLVALGLKRLGITVVGYLLFLGTLSIVLGTIITILAQLGIITGFFVWILVFFASLIMTRVVVSERMEKREADVMNAVDLIVPEVGNGVKNAIVMYQDNFAPSIQEDFKVFINNIQDRGFSFEAAMYILADNLGLVFHDFAQKAIYFEAVGEKDMKEIFTDISETNRLRRQLRDENDAAFANLKGTFVISTLMTFGYFVFLLITDDFSRHFFLETLVGKFLLLIMIVVVFLVLSYISTIKSKTI